MSPRVSIVVPSYNHARFVPQCLESVLAQTFPDWELIVVDDRSSDDSLTVWKRYKDPRIRVVQNEANIGTYATQNRGVSLASADLVAILNSDDFWHPEKLEKQVWLFEKHPEAALCYTLGFLADEDGEQDWSVDHHLDWPTDELQELFPWLLEENRVFASSVIFRREFAVFDDSLAYSGDWMALLRASWERPVCCVADRLSFWRIHGAGAHHYSVAMAREGIRMRTMLLNERRRLLRSRFDSRLVRRKLGASAMHVCALYVLLGDLKMARLAGLTALRLHSDKRRALKRLLACFLPLAKVRSHLWPDQPPLSGDGKAAAGIPSLAWAARNE